ncbi:DUF427 domain-containing protein [Qaidamihabitans albus]|uniref:DUF427 domain-containing protein n=1 Tax=Qaidamihabitans albus TaxID=2795733 RepID=UPI0018F26731|nr:DUF427 domain-containing protein [Qaidamihabitans albus]
MTRRPYPAVTALNGTVLAEAPHTVRIEGNHYFPPETVKQQQLSRSRMKTLCPWKGIAWNEGEQGNRRRLFGHARTS